MFTCLHVYVFRRGCVRGVHGVCLRVCTCVQARVLWEVWDCVLGACVSVFKDVYVRDNRETTERRQRDDIRQTNTEQRTHGERTVSEMRVKRG